MFCGPRVVPVRVVVGQKHRDPPGEQWLAGLEACAVSSLGRFILSCVSCNEAGTVG
jgi:hypothetical protein